VASKARAAKTVPQPELSHAPLGQARMSRHRYLSSTISTDTRVAELATRSLLAALLYTWAIPHADDAGCLPADAWELKLLVLPGVPADRAAMEAVVTLIIEAGLWISEPVAHLIRYPEESWLAHQNYIGKGRHGLRLDERLHRANPRISPQNPAFPRKTPQNPTAHIVAPSVPPVIPALNAANATTPTTRKPTATAFAGNFLSLWSDSEREGLQARFPGVNLAWEETKCWAYWSEGKRKLQRPKTAYLNWLGRSRGDGRPAEPGKASKGKPAMPVAHIRPITNITDDELDQLEGGSHGTPP